MHGRLARRRAGTRSTGHAPRVEARWRDPSRPPEPWTGRALTLSAWKRCRRRRSRTRPSGPVDREPARRPAGRRGPARPGVQKALDDFLARQEARPRRDRSRDLAPLLDGGRATSSPAASGCARPSATGAGAAPAARTAPRSSRPRPALELLPGVRAGPRRRDGRAATPGAAGPPCTAGSPRCTASSAGPATPTRFGEAGGDPGRRPVPVLGDELLATERAAGAAAAARPARGLRHRCAPS